VPARRQPAERVAIGGDHLDAGAERAQLVDEPGSAALVGDDEEAPVAEAWVRSERFGAGASGLDGGREPVGAQRHGGARPDGDERRRRQEAHVRGFDLLWLGFRFRFHRRRSLTYGAEFFWEGGCVPRWRARILPGITLCPPNDLTPSRCAAESRPLREDPPAFL